MFELQVAKELIIGNTPSSKEILKHPQQTINQPFGCGWELRALCLRSGFAVCWSLGARGFNIKTQGFRSFLSSG